MSDLAKTFRVGLIGTGRISDIYTELTPTPEICRD
jgi:hypothetical protein